MKNKKYLWGILIIISLVTVFYLSYRITYEKLINRPTTSYWNKNSSITVFKGRVNNIK